jgi:hypothetical protein
MPPEYGNSNPLPPGYSTTRPVPDGTYTFSQPPVYVDPNYYSITFGLISIAQAIDRLTEALLKNPPPAKNPGVQATRKKPRG